MSSNISQAKNAALKRQKCPLARGIWAIQGLHFLPSWPEKLFLDAFLPCLGALGVVGHRGFTVVLRIVRKR